MSQSVETLRELHPDDAYALVNRLFNTIVDALIEHGGSVKRFLGDGALGVFGAPHARETDPERAIFAALRIRDSARELGIEVTVGINTGAAYVGGIGSDRYQEATVVGAAVNLAARLQDHAAPGEILVGEATYRLASGRFQFSSRLLELKGYPQAVPAYVVERPLLQPGRSRPTRQHDSPLIGRSEELFRILQVVRDTQLGRGGVVTLTGDAGVGKSRLLAEVKATVMPSRRDAEGGFGPSIQWLQGGCVEFGQAAGYHPFLEVFRQWLSGAEAESEELCRQRLNEALEQLGRRGAIEAYLLPPLQDLASDALGLTRLDASPRPDIGTVEARHRTFTAVRGFFRALASAQPLVLVLEDLHWADSLSLDLLATLLDMTQEVPLTLICTYRSDGEQSFQRLQHLLRVRAPKACTQLELVELSDEHSRNLVAALLPPDFADEEVTFQVVQRCRGNPFFIEEVVGALLQTNPVTHDSPRPQSMPKMEAVSVPAALQSVILSRVDRLPEASRILLQHAAVLGSRFQGRVLEKLGHTRAELLDGLSRLEEHRLVNRKGRAAIGEYAFNHVLIQETVYSTLVKKKRVQLHQQAAEALESVYSGRLDQVCEVIAEHYSRTDCTAQAVRYLALAGRKANQLYANREAISYYRQALDLRSRITPGGVLDELMLEVLEALGEVLFRTGDHAAAETCFTELLASLPESPPRRHAAVLWRLADAVHWQGQPERAIHLADRGLALLDPDRPCAETANLLEVSMRSAWALDDLETASRYAARLEEITPRMDYFDAAYMIYYAQAWLAMQLKNYERAQSWLELMEAVCRRHGSENGLARCYHGLGDLSRATGDLEGAARWFERSLEYCRRTGDAHLLLEGNLELAHALVLSDGPPERIEQHLTHGMRIAENMAATGAVSSVHTLCEALASAYVRRNNPERAIHFFRRSFDFGPHPSPERPLQKLEPLYADLGRSEEFTEFARIIRRDG